MRIKAISLFILILLLSGCIKFSKNDSNSIDVDKFIEIIGTSCYDGKITISLLNNGRDKIHDKDLKILVDNIDQSIYFDFGEIAPNSYYTTTDIRPTPFKGDTHKITIVGPNNSVNSSVYCHFFNRKTLAILDISCQDGKIEINLANFGDVGINDKEIKVLVDSVDRSDNFEFGNIQPENSSVSKGNYIESPGVHTVDIISPSNAVRENVYC
ncbi:MAG: hypothetical protein ISS48_01420 [Candidatus Aenigmarchaeota archaeon]|nr:hypothetical protein [Candidatus Aenigmarchaeota archaeon]